MQLPHLFRWLLPALLLPLTTLAQTPGVGIGTTAPDASAALDIVSSDKGALLPRVADATTIATPATGLLVFQTGAPAGFYYNAGNSTTPSWQLLATAGGTVTTASNGLTKTGSDVALGGTLNQNTVVALGGNRFDLSSAVATGAAVTDQSDISSGNSISSYGELLYQTFQPGISGLLTQVQLRLFSTSSVAAPPLTLRAGAGTDGALLATATPPAGISGGGAYTYTFGGAVLTAGQTYTLVLDNSATAGVVLWAGNSSNPYPNGVSNLGNSVDFLFTTIMRPATVQPLLSATGGTVGIGTGTGAPTATLDVNGSTRLRGLGAGVVSADNQGNLSSSSATATFGSSFIQNTTTPQAGASFNIGGSGTVSGGLTVSGTTSINPGSGTTSIGGPGSTTTIGDGGIIRIGTGGGNTNIGGLGSLTTIGNGGPVRIGSGGASTFLQGLISIGEDPNSVTVIGTGGGSGPVSLGRSDGVVQVRSLPTAGVVTTDAQGVLSSASAASLDATTASNGLTRNGQNVQLGGTLTQNTAVALGSSSLTVSGTATTSQQISQPAATNSVGGATNVGQTFTLPAGATITRVDVYGNGGTGTFAIYQGEPGGSAPLGSQPVTYSAGLALTSLVLNPAITTGAAGTYSFLTGSPNLFASSSGNPYPDGAVRIGPNSGIASVDLKFAVYYTTSTVAPTLYLASGNSVGIGTNSPTALLDVAGPARLRGLTTAGVVTTDASGNLSSQPLPAAPTGADFIQNQSAADQAGAFRLTGSGVLGGNLGVGSTALPAQRLSITSADNSAATDIVKVTSLNGASGVSLGYFGLRASGSNANDRLTLDAKGTGSILLGTSGGTGNVGIGTTSPDQKLDVNGSAAVSGNVGIGTTSPGTRLSISPTTTEAKITLYEGNGTDHYGFGISGGQLNYHVQSTSDQHVFYAKGRNASAGSVELLRIQGNGRVGIGTSSPIAPLHVSGSASATPSGAKTFFSVNATGLSTESNVAPRGVVAYFTGGQFWVNDVVVAGQLNVSSDRRIKRVIGLSDRAADLALLQQVRITDYTYIDQLSNTDKVVRKVIAQEVKELLPAAVSQSRQAIPNVYERAASVRYADGYVTLRTSKPHELPATGGTLRLYTPQNQELSVAATVLDAHTVRFASADSHAEGLFVYGKYVDDFLSVDYDALTTLNVSATQELARKVEALERQNAALQTGAAADHAALLTLQEQMARLLGETPAPAQARR